jgi:outer membrane PBP1 activator LpoA protein
MQRVFLWLSVFLALYVSGFACATDEQPAIVALAPGNERPVPHIALLLPLKSAIFGAAAEAVQQGFQVAAGQDLQSLPVRVYGCFDENNDIVALYRLAIASGARAIVGPLTRSGAYALAAEKDISVPTLVLNATDGAAAGQLYFFGMAVEAEARQVAQLAARNELHQAIVIATRTQLSNRLQLAFEDEWRASGGSLLQGVEYNGDPAVLAGILDLPGTAVFLALEAGQAAQIRPYLPGKLQIYATSQIFAGNHDTLTNYDLDGIRFVDMPWLLQIEHPAVMIYPRANPPLPVERERLYALGIDAFRLIQLLLADKIYGSLPMDGVSGNIQLHGRVFQRVAAPAIFSQGQAQLGNGQAVPALPVFPDQTAGKP